jgi:hypothetical protein
VAHNRENLDPSIFTDDESAFDLFMNSIRAGTVRDAFQGKTRFHAIVLTMPLPIGTWDPGNTNNDKDTASADRFKFRARIIDNPTPHAIYPDPCDPDIADDLLSALKRIKLHTEFYSSENSSAVKPSKNDIVIVELKPNVFSYNLTEGEYVGIVSRTEAAAKGLSTDGCIAASAFAAGASGISIGGGTNVLYTLQSQSSEAASTDVIVGTELPSLTSLVESELAAWTGKTESDSSMYDTLKKYWENVGYSDSQWTPSSVPWSAAFVSYVMTQADSSFPKSAAHYLYTDSAVAGTGGWTSWDVSSGKFKAQVGDILVKTRSGAGTSSTSTHGDVIYKVQNGKAYIAGGNVSNTAKETEATSLTAEGYYQSTGEYLVILKKNGKITSTVA